MADCRSSENASWMVFPSARTTALVSEGGARSVILMLTSVPAVQEKPGLNQVLVRVVASAKAKEVWPTTMVRSLVAAVMSASTVNEKEVAFRFKTVKE